MLTAYRDWVCEIRGVVCTWILRMKCMDLSVRLGLATSVRHYLFECFPKTGLWLGPFHEGSVLLTDNEWCPRRFVGAVYICSDGQAIRGQFRLRRFGRSILLLWLCGKRQWRDLGNSGYDLHTIGIRVTSLMSNCKRPLRETQWHKVTCILIFLWGWILILETHFSRGNGS